MSDGTRARGRMRNVAGQIVLALYFALVPSVVPDWRADPGIRTVAILPIGEPVSPLRPRP